jgi:hypothetical protein
VSLDDLHIDEKIKSIIVEYYWKSNTDADTDKLYHEFIIKAIESILKRWCVKPQYLQIDLNIWFWFVDLLIDELERIGVIKYDGDWSIKILIKK